MIRIGPEPNPLNTQERPVRFFPSPANLSVEGTVDQSRRDPPGDQSAEALQAALSAANESECRYLSSQER
jgi:hypothetical protein